MTALHRAAKVDARRGPRQRTARGWLAARLLRVLSAVLRPLPDGPLHHLASGIGGLLYWAQPRRRRLVRANLGRVVGYLAAHNMGGERVAAAARDNHALDRLVRDAFGHYVRGYLEGAILPAYASEKRLAKIHLDDASLVDRALGVRGQQRSGGLIIVGLHFGAIEIPGLWATKRLGLRITAPMETVADPDIQSYFEQTRAASGLNLVPVQRAAAELRPALERSEAVALVADRPIGGSGTPIELFGTPARLPIGPAVLALETGAPAWLVTTRRTGWGEYGARLEQIEMPAGGTRRERLAGFMAAEARAFERAIADAPEQWWTAFFPVWDDLSR